MALILIIIIITSITVVIMGTLKILTKTSGKYSIDRNATGVLNSRKAMGRYICFKYDNRLFQALVEYNSDGSIMNQKVDAISTSDNCTFPIRTGVNQYRMTLIGGGAGGSQSSFGSILNYIAPTPPILVPVSSTDNSDALFVGNNGAEFNNEHYRAEIYWTHETCSSSAKISSDGNDTGNLNSFISNPKICFIDEHTGGNACKCYLKGEEPDEYKNPRTQEEMNEIERLTLHKTTTQKSSYDEKKDIYYIQIFDRLLNDTVVISARYGGQPSELNFISMIQALYRTYNLCRYTPSVTYRSASSAAPGKVVQFVVTKAELDNTQTFVICRDKNPNSCHGSIGDGGKMNQQGGETTFRYNQKDSDGTIKLKEYTTGMAKAADITPQDIDYNEISDQITQGKLFAEPGKDADYLLSDDFNLLHNPDYNFNLHSGYVFEDEISHEADVKKATLFGSSGAITTPKEINCTLDDSKTYRLQSPDIPSGVAACTTSGCLPCSKTNGSSFCENSLNSRFDEKLEGAPGAIIIEW